MELHKKAEPGGVGQGSRANKGVRAEVCECMRRKRRELWF